MKPYTLILNAIVYNFENAPKLVRIQTDDLNKCLNENFHTITHVIVGHPPVEYCAVGDPEEIQEFKYNGD